MAGPKSTIDLFSIDFVPKRGYDMSMEKPLVKGTAIIPVDVYIKTRWGMKGREKIWQGLGPEARQVLSGRLVPLSWYPLSVISELYQKISEIYGSGRPEFCRPIGRDAADYGLTFVHKLILRFNTPELLARRGPELWSSYYQPSIMDMSESVPGKVVAVIKGLDTSPAHLESIAGWMERVAELVGGKNVKVTIDLQEYRYQITYPLDS